jgi:ribosomal protein S18 acetylase RimI-like enzyme
VIVVADAARFARHSPGDRWFVGETYVKVDGVTAPPPRHGVDHVGGRRRVRAEGAVEAVHCVNRRCEMARLQWQYPYRTMAGPPQTNDPDMSVAGSDDGAVRRAVAADVPAIARVLADAFADYPWTRWTVSGDGHAVRLLALQTTYLSALGIPYGWVDVAELNGAIAAAAVWMRSDVAVPERVLAEVGQAVAELSGDRAEVAAHAEAFLAPHRPTDPHIALATIGVGPGVQGRGVGSAVLTAGLHAVDRLRLPAYLETSADGNVRFYQRHGFEVTAAVDMPDGGPRTWCMRRRPGPAR